MVKKILLVFVFCLISVSLCFAQVFELEGRYWMANLEGKAKVTGNISVGGVNIDRGTEVDFKDDLGLDDENFAEVRLTAGLGPLGSIRACYMPISYSGTKRIEQTIEYYGYSYTTGYDVATEFDAQYVRFGWYSQFSLLDKVKVGPIIDIKAIMSETKLDSSQQSLSPSYGLDGVFPTIGLIAEVNPMDNLSFTAEASGIAASGYGHFVDAEVGAKYSPLSHVYLKAGWRLFEIEMEDDDDYLNLTISGPFVGATIEF